MAFRVMNDNIPDGSIEPPEDADSCTYQPGDHERASSYVGDFTVGKEYPVVERPGGIMEVWDGSGESYRLPMMTYKMMFGGDNSEDSDSNKGE